MLVEKIGINAVLEATAGGCNELYKTCLKLARFKRNGSPVDKSKDDICQDLVEEIADVMICVGELTNSGLVSTEAIESEMLKKNKRMRERLGL